MVIDIYPQGDPEPIDIFDRNCVLIMDNDREYLKYLTSCFSQQNFKVLSHTSGELGLQTARKLEPDCILINLELLDMDGISLCQTIVDDSQTCGIPVIVMGKTDDRDVIRQAKAAGCEFFVAKPIDPKNLLMLVNETIAEARSWICE